MPLGNKDLEDQMIRTHNASNIWLLAKFYADTARRAVDEYHAFFGYASLWLCAPKQPLTEIKTACFSETS